MHGALQPLATCPPSCQAPCTSRINNVTLCYARLIRTPGIIQSWSAVRQRHVDTFMGRFRWYTCPLLWCCSAASSPSSYAWVTAVRTLGTKSV